MKISKIIMKKWGLSIVVNNLSSTKYLCNNKSIDVKTYKSMYKIQIMAYFLLIITFLKIYLIKK